MQQKQKYKYCKQIDLGYKPNGSRNRQRIYYNSQAEFNRKYAELYKKYEEYRNPDLITLGKYIDIWTEAYLSKREAQTIEYYETGLKKFELLSHKPLREITKTDLQAIINDNREHPRTCRKIKQIISKIMESAIDDGYINFNPAKRLDLPPYKAVEKRALTDQEDAAIKRVELPPMEHMGLMLLYVFGLRPEELRALNRNSFDFKNMTMTISNAVAFKYNTPYLKDTKNHKVRVLPIPEVLLPELKEYLRNLDGLYLFYCSTDPLMTKSAFTKFTYRIFKTINAELGGNNNLNVLNGMTLYTFRHNVGTRLYYTEGLTNKMKAAFMGHSEEVFLKTYSHLDESKEDLSKYFDAINL